eukprot:c4598_g1_i2.p1 GENE.c4598_g1_i2~~c4598_g1_i2.p1  ORF type:complete len:1117 (+),score=273.05 c4598_g1_i2:1-3351(+)
MGDIESCCSKTNLPSRRSYQPIQVYDQITMHSSPFQLASIFAVFGLALAGPCIQSADTAVPYSQLATANWTGQINGFCQPFFSESDLIQPISNLTCDGDGGDLVNALRTIMGGLTPKCQALFGQFSCLYHLPILSSGNLVLPCTRPQSIAVGPIASADTLTTFFAQRCLTAAAPIAISAFTQAFQKVDDVLDTNLELRSSCRVLDASWIPDFDMWSCPSPLAKSFSTNIRSNDIACAEPCPSMSFSEETWSNMRYFVLVPNSISIAVIIAVMIFRRQLRSALSRRLFHMMLAILGIHAAIGISTVAEVIPDNDVFSISCQDDFSVSSNHRPVCGFQGAVLIYFIKSTVAWWFVVVIAIDMALRGKQNGSIVLSCWFGYAYPALWVIISLATQKMGHVDEYPWCFVSSGENGFWQYWFVFGDMLIIIALTLALLVRMTLATTPNNKTKTADPATSLVIAPPKCRGFALALIGYGLLVWVSMLVVRFTKTASHGQITQHDQDWLTCLFESASVDSNSNLILECIRQTAPHATSAQVATAALCCFGAIVGVIYACFELLYSGAFAKISSMHIDLILPIHFARSSSKHNSNNNPNTNNNRNSTAMAVFGVPKSPITDSDGAFAYDFVILGGGTAAVFAARKFAESNKEKYTVAVVSRESNTPFCPKVLVQALADNTSPAVSIMQDEAWFKDNGITLFLNTNVTHADLKGRLLVGERDDTTNPTAAPRHLRIRANRALILAMGARPANGPPVVRLDRLPGDEEIASVASVDTLRESVGSFRNPFHNNIEGYFTLRTFSTGLKINEYLGFAKKVVVVGGGFLGLDIAYIARSRGLDVTLVCSSDHVLRRIFTPVMSQMYQDFFVSHGVKLAMGKACVQVFADHERVVGVGLKDGTRIDCDMCVVACGVCPNIDLVRGQCQLEKGTSTPAILVDSFLVTSVPGVYAIGDVCAMRYAQHNPGAIRHCSNARMGGSHVVETLLDAIQTTKRRASRVSDVSHKPKPTKAEDQILELLRPGMGARPFVPHPAYDVNHFHFKGYVTGDRLGPDFVMVGNDMGPNSKMVTFWMWENRVVGAYVSNPTPEEKLLLDEATRDQWYIEHMPELRTMTDAYHALEHLRVFHRL